MPRRWLALLSSLLFVAAVVPVPAGGQPAPGQAAPVPVVVIDGKGFGHGVGMAQDGAYWMARAGASTPQILGHFYPGTGVGRASGPVRVNVFAPGSDAVLQFPGGGEVRDGRAGSSGDGFPVRVQPGGSVRVGWTGSRYVARPMSAATLSAPSSTATGAEPAPDRVEPHQGGDPPTTTTTTPPPVPTTSTTAPRPPAPAPSSTTSTTAPPEPPDEPDSPTGRTEAVSTRPLWAVPAGGATITVPARTRTYRGLIEATASGGPFRLVNEVDVETYLKGMGEVRNPSWPPAGLRAQAIAARTYALRAMAAGGELCDTQRCQVYLGAQAEYAAMNKAVADTAGQVVVFGRTMASTVYSANGGGFSASAEEGFGTSGAGYPYLRPAPYETSDPVPWSVTVSYSDVAARLAYAGTITDVRVTRRGPSGRATEIVIDGSAGPKAVNGLTFDAALGLRSTLFSLRLDVADAPPPPPSPADSIQLPPDAVAPHPGGDVVPDLPDGPADDVAIATPGTTRVPSVLALLALILQGLAFLAVPGARTVPSTRQRRPD